MLNSILNWHGDTPSWAAVAEAVYKTGDYS